MLEILDKIIAGEGTMEDLDKLEDLAKKIKASAFCGLGQTAPNPVLSTLRNFRSEYEAHILEKRCPTGECDPLIDIEIDPANCIKCGLCIRRCPVGAISSDFKVDPAKCTRCKACFDACPKQTICKISPRRSN
jgi:ferredoxin